MLKKRKKSRESSRSCWKWLNREMPWLHCLKRTDSGERSCWDEWDDTSLVEETTVLCGMSGGSSGLTLNKYWVEWDFNR